MKKIKTRHLKQIVGGVDGQFLAEGIQRVIEKQQLVFGHVEGQLLSNVIQNVIQGPTR